MGASLAPRLCMFVQGLVKVKGPASIDVDTNKDKDTDINII